MSHVLMRVISGLQKGRQLQSQASSHLRPTSGRVKEALFSILGSRVIGARMVDLFAGTGSIGLEALSRGAQRVVFVEHRRSSLDVLRENLKRCGHPAGAAIIPRAATLCFQHPEFQQGSSFDLVFADPPYAMVELESLLASIQEYITLSPESLVIIEHHKKTSLPTHVGALSQTRQSRYGDTTLTFFQPSSESSYHANWCVPRDI